MSIFFKNCQEQKDYIEKKLSRIYPSFKTGGYFFRKYLKNYINGDSIILDAGCGSGGIISEFKSVPRLIIGLDIDEKLLETNQIADKKIVADLEKIPLEDKSVDIVVSEFVLEHLKNPELVFKEIFRIVRPGGKFIFLTSNVLNLVMILSKILPLEAHRFLRRKLLKKEEDACSTFYKTNTYRKLLKLGISVGFQEYEILRAGNPEYLGFCKPLACLSIIFEKIIDRSFLNIFKMYLIGCFVKR